MKIQILTMRHNEQALKIIEQEKELARLKDQLILYKNVLQSEGSSSQNSKRR